MHKAGIEFSHSILTSVMKENRKFQLALEHTNLNKTRQ